MPFLFRCRKCGYIIVDNFKPLFLMKVAEHMRKSHRNKYDPKKDIFITVIPNSIYEMYIIHSKNPKFWDAINKALSNKP